MIVICCLLQRSRDKHTKWNRNKAKRYNSIEASRVSDREDSWLMLGIQFFIAFFYFGIRDSCARAGGKAQLNKVMAASSWCACKAYLTLARKGDVYKLHTFKMHANDHAHELGDPIPRMNKQKLNEVSTEAKYDMELLIDCEVPVLAIKQFITKVCCLLQVVGFCLHSVSLN